MSVKKAPKHPKQLIIDHYDSLVNKVDVYVEQLMEKYGDDELLEESESRAITKDDYKKSDFKIVDDNDEEEESEDEVKIEKDKSDSDEESEEDDSDDENPFRLLERRYIYIDSDDENDAELSKCEDSEDEDNEENEDEESEDSEVDDNDEKEDDEDTEGSEDEKNKEDTNEKEEDIKVDQKDKERKVDENEEKEDKHDQNEEEKNEKEEDIDIDREDRESEEGDEIDDDLNNYSYYDYDAWDENNENIDDDDFYEELIYGIEGFTEPYYFDFKPNKQAQFELKERSSIKTKDYLNQVRSFMIDEIRKAETQQLESYEANKAGFEFDKNSSIGEMKKEIFKDLFCFLIDTKTDQKRSEDFSTSRQKKNRVFNLCLIITDFYLSTSQLNRIKYVLNHHLIFMKFYLYFYTLKVVF